MSKGYDNKASEKYFKPKDRFYEFLEQHEVLGQLRRKQERKGAAYMTLFFCFMVGLAVITHENAEYGLVTQIFAPE